MLYSSQKKQEGKYPSKYKYLSSVVNLGNKVPKKHNLAKLLKYPINKLTVSEVTE